MKKLFMLTVLVTGLAFVSKIHANPPDVHDHPALEKNGSADRSFLMSGTFDLNDHAAIVLGVGAPEVFAHLVALLDPGFILIASPVDERPGKFKRDTIPLNLDDLLMLDAEILSKTAKATSTSFNDFAFNDQIHSTAEYQSNYPKPTNTRITTFKGFAYPPALHSRSSI